MLSDIFTQDGMDFGLATSGNDSITMSRLPPNQLSYFDSSPLTDAVALLEGDDYAINNGNPRIFYGNQGNDTAIGGANNETLFGGQNNDFLDGDFGDDLLFGNKGNDDLNGGFGNDQLYGGQGNDVVVGGAGNDTISGDRDLDTLTGGDGADEFFLASSGSDRDVITDFQPGIDKLRAPSGVTRVEIQDSGSSILILNNGGDTLATLNNLEPLDISIDDFIGIAEIVYPPTLPGGIDIYDRSPLDGFEAEEIELYNSINEYRAENNLPPIPASKALTTVANRHVLDLGENIGEVTHSWSDAPYSPSDSNTWSNMWTAPQRFDTGYPGNGYENVTGYSGFDGSTMTAQEALESWKNSPAHNAVILNQGQWADLEWNALGVGLYEGYGVLWFGEEVDPTGTPDGF